MLLLLVEVFDYGDLCGEKDRNIPHTSILCESYNKQRSFFDDMSIHLIVGSYAKLLGTSPPLPIIPNHCY